MKNLIRLYSEILNFDISTIKFIILNQSENSENHDTNKKFFIITTDSRIYEFNNNELKKLYEFNKVISNRNIINGEHLILNDELCIAFDSGEVIVLNLENLRHQQTNSSGIEEVSYCSGGIQEMKWSPDQEIVTFITKSKKVVTMTSTYDPIFEAELDDFSAFGDGEFINVGWGKKETQFHGSEGKQAAKQKSEFKPPEKLNELLQDINISWRGDGELFAVSFTGEYGRMFKVFNREGMLQYTSEKLNNLGECIAWRPSGSWIAVPHQLISGKYAIGLFEKNGLRHREIILPFKKENEEIYKLEWNSGSDILSILTKSKEKTFLYIYTMSNYHWYLKDFNEYSSRVVDIKWDINSGKSLYIFFANGEYHFHKYSYIITTNYIRSVENQAVVAVIDGSSVFLTDFRNKIIPPPMSTYTVENDSYIIQCGFIKYSDSIENINNLFIIDSKNFISFYQLIFEKKLTSNLKEAKLMKKILLFNENYVITNHWIWLNLNTMVFTKVNSNKNYELCLLDINENTVTDKFEIKSLFGSVAEINDKQFVLNFIQGTVKKFSVINNKLQHEDLLMYEMLPFCEKIQINECDQLVALRTINSNLYFNSINIADNVTSFALTDNYVVFTQINSMKFYRIKDNKICDERKIERGGKLITIVPYDSKVILQMPRGNLEAINPRILSLEIIGNLLDNLEYKKAMDTIRKQRINLNILFDHNPDVFLKNTDKFLTEISNPNWLNLFFSDLQNADFSITMYGSNYTQDKKYPDGYKPELKIVYICEKLCDEMKKKNFQIYLLPIITTYVKCNNLEMALEIIWSEKKMEIANKPENTEDKSRSEEALKYLLYMVDVNQLYNVALGMYDFGLVLFVANKSQKDPKEYVPFLNELKKYEESYRRFKIDEYLKRNEKALEHVANCADDIFDEILIFIKKHNLYQQGLQIFDNSELRYKEISISFADYLRNEGKLENASIMYERGGNINQAILSAKNILDWRRCLMLTATNYLNNPMELEKCTLSLVNALEQNGKYDEAFDLLKMFTKNFEQALSILLKGKKFLRAIFEAKFLMPDFIQLKLVPELRSYAIFLQDLMNTDKVSFILYKKRLETIRKNKLNKEHEIEDGVDMCDIISDTTSMNSSSKFTNSSSRTGKTFRSSKNRRKHERKLLSLKEGNPFEDIAIVDYLHNHVVKIMSQQEHIRDICKALLEIRVDCVAKLIQNQFKDLLDIIKKSLDEIWINEIDVNETQNKIITDYNLFQNEQHYRLLSPLKRIKPQLILISWEQDIISGN